MKFDNDKKSIYYKSKKKQKHSNIHRNVCEKRH